MPKQTISLEKSDPRELFGPNDQHVRLLESRFPETKITSRGQELKLDGPDDQVQCLLEIFNEMMSMIRRGITITKQDVQTLIAVSGTIRSFSDSGLSEPDVDKTFFPAEPASSSSQATNVAIPPGDLILHTHAGEPVLAKTPGQREIVKASTKNDIVFAIGPAGTGKTFTSVALAVSALKTKQVKKIILARPAVEAGESLGFLPGALKEKIDPYLRPLYDALEEMIDHDRLEFNLARNIIEIAPLAYMRGRTLNNAFVILDEAQNATHTQMKMFLTRIGFHSRAIITGDITQTDLPKSAKSGLVSIQKILDGIPGIEFVHLGKEDVVRHRLVRDIIKAYEDFEEKEDS